MKAALGALVVLLTGCCGCAAPAPAPWEPVSHSYYCDYKTPTAPSCRHRI